MKLSTDEALQQAADAIADAVGTTLEVNGDFVDRYCSEDVRRLVDLLDDDDLERVIVDALGDAREWGYHAADSCLIIPYGEIEVQLPDHLDSWGEYLDDPDDWTISGDLAYHPLVSVRIDIDMERLHEGLLEVFSEGLEPPKATAFDD